MNWLFSQEAPLPRGLELALVGTVSGELGTRRLATAEAVLGGGEANAVAHRLGRYELDQQLVNQLTAAGVKLDSGGEVPTLSPERWGESLPALEHDQVVGIYLNANDRREFLDFLARHKWTEAPWEKIYSLARHFFFREPLRVVVKARSREQ